MRDALELRRGQPAQLVRPAAWQTIFHFHVHVIPRYEDDPLQLPRRPQQAEPDELAEVGELLRG